MVWKPYFDALNTATLEEMYPPRALRDDALIPSLNHLALHQLIYSRATHPEIFFEGSEHRPMQRLLERTNKKLGQAKLNLHSAASIIIAYSDAFRAEEIARPSALLNR